jgi:hypothetical protein
VAKIKMRIRLQVLHSSGNEKRMSEFTVVFGYDDHNTSVVVGAVIVAGG